MTEATTESTHSAAAHAPPPYALYFRAWAALLVITLVMVCTGHPAILLIGMAAKASIIAAFFMHLKYESRDFVIMIAGCIVVFSAVLWLLILPDGLAMG